MIRQAAALRLLFTLAVSLPTAAHSVRIPISVSPGDQQLGRASQSGKLSCVAITRFATPAEIKTLHWPAITDLGQAINKLVCDASGNVKPDDVVTWPMKHLVDAAHGNGTRIYTALSFDSKQSAASFFQRNVPSELDAVASAALDLVVSAGYDGLQLDIEGLKPQSQKGFEGLVSAFQRAVLALPAGAPSGRRDAPSSSDQAASTAAVVGRTPPSFGQAAGQAGGAFSLSLTVYGPKLVAPSPLTAYNVTFLAPLVDHIFIMGYDMTWLGAKPGGLLAGPNAPLNSLRLALNNSIGQLHVPARKLVLGLPFYGRAFLCDGKEPAQPSHGNCSCSEKNFKKKGIGILMNVTAAGQGEKDGCFESFDEPSATPFWECADGAGIAGMPTTGRQQGWFENGRSMQNKLSLATQFDLKGVGIWSGGGCDSEGSSPVATECAAIWAEFVKYVAGMTQ